MASTEWETPEEFFNSLDKEFHFTIDVCASHKNKKCRNYFTEFCDGLSQIWWGACWCNPPYDRNIGLWLKKAYESAHIGCTVVCLIQGRSTDTKWWHRYVMKASEIRFIKDCLHFGLDGNFRRANISSVVVVFRPGCQGPPNVSAIDTKGNLV